MEQTPSTIEVYIDPDWLKTSERLLPLARYLYGIKEKALPTFRDEFVHNMTFENVELCENANKSNFIFIPIDYSRTAAKKYAKLMDTAERLSVRTNKTVVVQSHSQDIVDPESLELAFSNSVYLNSSLIKSLSPPHFHALPYFIPDCLERYFGGNVTILKKSDKPNVGFCGVAAPLKTPMSKTKAFDHLRLALTKMDGFGLDSEKIARALGTNMKHAHRTRSVMNLRKSALVNTDFKLREQGGLVTNQYTNSSDLDSYNVEFYENLNNNLYSLCARGTENYSVRF